jgi:putative copper resistance protein D
LTQLSTFFAWPLIVASITIFGTSAFVLFVAPAVSGVDSPLRSFSRLWFWLALSNLAVSPLEMLTQVASMADSTFRDAITIVPSVMRETVLGHAWAIRLPLAVILACITAIRRPSRFVIRLVFVFSGAILLIQSIASHAIDKGAFAVAILFAHQCAAGVWFGSLVCLLMASAKRAGAKWLQAAAPRVSKTAGWSVAALAATGAMQAYDVLGWQISLLIYSIYGRTLLWKLITAGAVVLVGGYNRYQLVPAVDEHSARAMLTRNVAVECVLLTAVLGWSAVLANTPPPH